MAYRTVTQDTCPHDSKVKMTGFKDRYECTRCQKILELIKMKLEQKYKNVFQSECNILSQAVLGSLLKLATNPKDMQELSKLVQNADTIMGGARFLDDKKLEQNATDIVKSFTDTSDVRKKIEEFGLAFEQFGLLVGKSGICPKGYMLVDRKCIPDNRSYIKSITKSKNI